MHRGCIEEGIYDRDWGIDLAAQVEGLM